MSIRPVSFSIPSTTELKIKFTEELSPLISATNFIVESMSGNVDDLEVLGATITEREVLVKTRPQVAGNYYLLKLVDTEDVEFASFRGTRMVQDDVTRYLYFVGIDTVNPVRDRLIDGAPGLFDVDNSLINKVYTAQGAEIFKAQRTVGELLSDNYLSESVEDEIRVRTAGATDRFANENAYELTRVAPTLTDTRTIHGEIEFSSTNGYERLDVFPVYPASLIQEIVSEEEITIDSESNSFDGFLLTLANKNIIKVLSVKLIPDGATEDCKGDLGQDYNIESFKYTLKDNFYDQDYAFGYEGLGDNQVLLSEFGNIDRPEILDKIVITYIYKNFGKRVVEDSIEVYRVETSENESVPSNISTFFLDYAPVVNSNNNVPTRGGVGFYKSENLSETPDEFSKELRYDVARLPSQPGEFSVNYENGQVFVFGATNAAEGTGRNNYVATYNYRKIFSQDLDYSLDGMDIVATPDRDLSGKEAFIDFRYELTYAEGIDYRFLSHIEVIDEQVKNNLSSSFSLKPSNTPVTNVFRVYNQTTGEVYSTVSFTDTEINFSGRRSPDIRNVEGELARFSRVVNEDLKVIGEFVAPSFNATITSNISNNSIVFSPGIPAELIDQNSDDYFFRVMEEDDDGVVSVYDVAINLFGAPDGNNIITSAAINSSATPPSLGAQVVIGPKAYVINLDNDGILNKNLDSIGSITNTSVEFRDTSIFGNEKYYESVVTNPGLEATDEGGISVALTARKTDTYYQNLSRLRRVGDFTIDYTYGVVYVAVERTSDVSIDQVSYYHREVDTYRNNVFTVSEASKKEKSSDSIDAAKKIYENLSNTDSVIEIIDLESTNVIYDGETTALDSNGVEQTVAEVLDDYTIVVPSDIISINGIYKTTDLTGAKLDSLVEAERLEEALSSDLSITVDNGGKNLYLASQVTFEDNIIDLKKKAQRRTLVSGTDLVITVLDSTATDFVEVKSIKTGLSLFDEELNLTKLSGLTLEASVPGVGTAVVSVRADVSLVDVDTSDYLFDSLGKRFAITAVDSTLSTVTITTPAENDVTATAPTMGAGAEIIVKPTVTISGGVMTLTIPSDGIIDAGELVEIIYLTSSTPEIGTPMVVDYKTGEVFVSYSHIFDSISVSYEYGDNQIDWSISNAINEGDQYYVSYKYGAMREALLANFGLLTSISLFRSFPLSFNRELYRDAVSGALQSFPKGPTTPSYEELIKSFTKIKPEITESIFGSWILGRDYLTPGAVESKGVLEFSRCKFDEGLMFNDDVAVSVPAISSLSLEEGTISAWVRPNWSGINNDATLTLDIDNIGLKRFYIERGTDPFNKLYDWVILDSTALSGSHDYSGQKYIYYNYKTIEDSTYSLSVGDFGVHKAFDNFNRLIRLDYETSLRIPFVSTTLSGHVIEDSVTAIDYFSADATRTLNPFNMMVDDLNKKYLVDFELRALRDFSTDAIITFNIGGGSLELTTLPTYDRPHMTKNCGCNIDNDIATLENFNDLEIEITLDSNLTLTDFKTNNSIIDDDPNGFIIADADDTYYSVIGFVDDSLETHYDSIPDIISGIIVKRFGDNIPQMSSLGSDGINSIIPNTQFILLYKTISPKLSTTSDSVAALGFDIRPQLVNWTNTHSYKVERDPKTNLSGFSIGGSKLEFFYTDLIDSTLTDVDSAYRGVTLSSTDSNILSSVEIEYVRGEFYNRLELTDIYIGADGYNPKRIPFSINRDDSSKTAVGMPAASDVSEGIFIGFDELCTSPLSDNIGQWVFRSRVEDLVEMPTSVVVTGSEYENVEELVEVDHKITGVITTDGEFSSVVRSTRDETTAGCTDGLICESSYKYCGNELLEGLGWIKKEETSSDLINVLIGGRETMFSSWAKHGDFTTSVSGNIYRMGPSANESSCSEEEEFLGNLVYVENPCPGGNAEVVVSCKVAQVDTGLIGGSAGAFAGVVSGNFTGMVPIHFNDGDVNIKVALSLSSSGEKLVMLLDAEDNSIVEIISHNWNDGSYHEYTLERDTDAGKIYLYINGLLFSENLVSSFSTVSYTDCDTLDREMIGLYVFDSALADIETFHLENGSNILDVDLITFTGRYMDGVDQFESDDIFVSTDSRVEFEFNTIPESDGYGDGYDGYTIQTITVDEILMSSDRLRYLFDTGEKEAEDRISIFKDGKGFLNFRIYDNSLGRKNEVGFFNIATNIKHFIAGELHHLAASWKINSFDEKDEMHLFVDGQEAPNIYKFGGKIPIRVNDKFSDVSKEALHNFLVKDIEFCDVFIDGTTLAGSYIFQSDSAGFSSDMIGRSIIVQSSALYPTLVGEEFIINSVSGNQVTFVRGSSLLPVEFDTSASDIVFQFPPTAGIINSVATDIRNDKFSIFRTTCEQEIEELGGVVYSVSSGGSISILSGDNIDYPKFRVNADTRVVEFVGQDDDCEYVATVDSTDLDVHIETFGLTGQRCRMDLELPSSSYDGITGYSEVKTVGMEPKSLSDVEITRVLLGRQEVLVGTTTVNGNGDDVSSFIIDVDETDPQRLLTSEEGNISKQGLGRKISVRFDTDNVNFCEDKDGYMFATGNYITVYGTTTDGSNEETFYIDSNKFFDGEKYFKTFDRVEGNFVVVDPDYFELGVIEVRETDPITVQNNNGDYAEINMFSNGIFRLTAAGSSGTFPFELHRGSYKLDYPAYMKVMVPTVGNRAYIGSDFNEVNQFGGLIDEFIIISEMSSDTRVYESETSGTRSVTDDYNKTIPACADSQTLCLVPFNNPIEKQSRQLRREEFLNTEDNYKFNLTLAQREKLLEFVNDEFKFASQMVNYGFTEFEAEKTFYEVHHAEGGPLYNEADYYPKYVDFVSSSTSVNDRFGSSGRFTEGRSFTIRNDDNFFRKDAGEIEFWVSPLIDTINDPEERYFIDAYSISRQKIVSKSSTIIELPSAAREIVEIRLLDRSVEFSEYYTQSEVDDILFDEIYRSDITGRLTGGTGVEKDFSTGHTLSANGEKVFLAESLPEENCSVLVTYVPISSSGDRVSVYKTTDSRLIFKIVADGVENVVSTEIDWRKNTWHRVRVSYKTNSDSDTMRIYVDGSEDGKILYGTGIVYGTGFVYGQLATQEGAARTVEYNIDLSDDFRIVSFGSDVFGDNSARSRMDNIRFSREQRAKVRDSSGDYIDENYSSNTNTVAPVIEDDITTLLLDFDEDLEKTDKFCTVTDPSRGIFEFDIDVYDNFDKVIGVNNGEIEDLIIELVNKLKLAHSNALVKFIKSRC